jgi:cobalt/nickel transport system permease protein
MGNNIPSYLLQPVNDQIDFTKVKKVKLTFLDKTIINSASAVKSIYLQAENATKENIIQKINPHIKLISLVYLAIIISLVNNLHAQLLTSALIFTLYIISRLKVFQVYRKIFFIAFIFGFLIVLPASLNVITPGKIILNIIAFNKPSHFWIYNIPQNIGLTENGLQVVALVFLRVLNSVSFALLIVFTTPFPALVKSLKIIGVPDTFLMIISLAYKYIFILSRTIEETYFALKSRLFMNIKKSNIRKLVGGRIFFIFKRSIIIYENTYYAMVSRGYNGKVVLHSSEKLAFRDFVALFIIIVLGIGILLIK